MDIRLNVTTHASDTPNAIMDSRDRQRFNIEITSPSQLTFNEVTLKIKFAVMNDEGDIDDAGIIDNVGYKIRHNREIHRTDYIVNSLAREITVRLSEFSGALSDLSEGSTVILNLDLKTGIHYISAQENGSLGSNERVVEFDMDTGEPYRTPTGTLCIKYWVDSVDIATQPPTTPSEVTSIIDVED